MSCSTLGFNVYLYYKVSVLLKSLLAEPELFADFSYLETWSKTFQVRNTLDENAKPNMASISR